MSGFAFGFGSGSGQASSYGMHGPAEELRVDGEKPRRKTNCFQAAFTTYVGLQEVAASGTK